MKEDLFYPCKKNEELFGLEVPYLNVICAFIYLANYTSPKHYLKIMCTILNPTTLSKDNIAYIAQIKLGYIKGDKIKHISLKFFYTHEW